MHRYKVFWFVHVFSPKPMLYISFVPGIIVVNFLKNTFDIHTSYRHSMVFQYIRHTHGVITSGFLGCLFSLL